MDTHAFALCSLNFGALTLYNSALYAEFDFEGRADALGDLDRQCHRNCRVY